MAWKTLAEALEGAIAQGMDCSADGIGVPDAEKKTPGTTEIGPASQQGRNVKHRKPRVLPDMSREIAVATPAPRRASPTRAAAISLVIIEGGRQDGGVIRPVAHTRSYGEGPVRDFVRLVHCASSS